MQADLEMHSVEECRFLYTVATALGIHNITPCNDIIMAARYSVYNHIHKCFWL